MQISSKHWKINPLEKFDDIIDSFDKNYARKRKLFDLKIEREEKGRKIIQKINEKDIKNFLKRKNKIKKLKLINRKA
jgi:hypothetical protein